MDDVDTEQAAAYPGARRPDRRTTVDSSGLALSKVEWGPADAPPIVVVHGGFDFAETLNVFAPLLVEMGWRVVSWDHRGHGQSEWAGLYSWEADLRDAAAVLDAIGPDPVPVVGHSKGGAVSLHLAEAYPHRFTHLVNLDGLPSRRSMPDVAEHERARLLSRELDAWLGHRRSIAGKERKPGTIAELAVRRGRMNTRLSDEWLRYLVTVGARRDDDGWRWRIDPTLRLGGFGPWRPEWTLQRLPGLSMPFMAVFGLEPEVMGWGTRRDDVERYLPDDAVLHELEGVGHFVHIERPDLVAELVADFVGAPS